MPWTRKDYPNAMKNLEDDIRDKAIEIANSLSEEGYKDERAISIGISRAKEWYENRGESISEDITHHLVPSDKGWKLESLEDKKDLYFDTKEEAMDKIDEMLKNRPIKVMVHDSDGKFQKVY